MKKIPLNEAAAGMVLGRDVFRNDNPVGMPICGKGTVLTDVLISRFQQMNIQTLFVNSDKAQAKRKISLEEMQEKLDRRFERVRHDPLAVKLHGIYSEYLKKTMGEDGEQLSE